MAGFEEIAFLSSVRWGYRVAQLNTFGLAAVVDHVRLCKLFLADMQLSDLFLGDFGTFLIDLRLKGAFSHRRSFFLSAYRGQL